MSDDVQTWHYGLVARHWAEHNTSGPEIEFFRRQIEMYGQPALDAGCGTGRLLLPFLRAGLDVDGCDVSEDMLRYCQQLAHQEGLTVHLYRQALHQLDLPRHYQTIFACGVFGIGVSRDQDFLALQRFHQHLLPGGVLLLEQYLPYKDQRVWPLWQKEARAHLPDPWPSYIGTPPAAGEQEYQLHYRLLSVNPLEQQTVGEMRTLLFKDGQAVIDETRQLSSNYYFYHELRMLLERAGFQIEAEKANWSEKTVSADDDVVVYVARKQA